MSRCNVRQSARPRKPRVIVGGIGTGGHYYPAVVVAQALKREDIEVIFLARRGFLEEKVAQDYGLRTFSISAYPFYGKSPTKKLRFLFSLIYAVYRLHALTRDAVSIAFGGFGTVPLVISCRINRQMYYLFESNRIAGRATRRFAGSAKRVFFGLPSVDKVGGISVVTGIPVRKEFKDVEKKPMRKKKNHGTSLLFYGGSQGARRLNDLALELQDTLPKKWRVTIISGSSDYERVARLRSGQTKVIPFIDSPWEVFSRADVVISRAGALAGYEILCFGKKVIFVPFPYAVDNHQYYNALYFSQVGDAIVLQEQDVNARMIIEQVGQFLAKKKKETVNIPKDAEKKIVDYMVQDMIYEKA